VKETQEPRLFRLVREVDESGVSGTGHVADGIVWHDGTCTVHWRTAHTSTTVFQTFADMVAIHGHGGKTRVHFAEHPFNLGAHCALMDAMENVPCGSAGGLGQRHALSAPAYVKEPDRAAWIAGYETKCAAMWGADWRTCAFGWTPALTISEATASAQEQTEGASPC
jgi:hypothetical protein